MAVGNTVTPAARNAIARPAPGPPAAQPRPSTMATASEQAMTPVTMPRRWARRTTGTAASGAPSGLASESSGSPSAPITGSTKRAEKAPAAARAARGISNRVVLGPSLPARGSGEAIPSR